MGGRREPGDELPGGLERFAEASPLPSRLSRNSGAGGNERFAAVPPFAAVMRLARTPTLADLGGTADFGIAFFITISLALPLPTSGGTEEARQLAMVLPRMGRKARAGSGSMARGFSVVTR